MNSENQVDLIDRYRWLTEIARDLASTLDLQTLLDRIVDAAAELCDGQAATILLYDKRRQELYFNAATNLDEPVMEDIVVPVDSSIAGWIVTNRQPVIISDTQQDPRHYDNVSETTRVVTTSMLGVPLVAKDKVVGALEVINKKRDDFNQDDQDLLMALGAQAAVAIENARLFQQSDLISEMVHELRTPLTSLNTAARLLMGPEISDEQREDTLDLLLGETERLAEMTTAFLDLARLETGRASYTVEEIDMSLCLMESVRVMRAKAQEKDIRIALETSVDLPLITADRDKLKQAILNLLSNAIKYNKPSGWIEVSATADETQMVINVRDTGIGISSESLDHVFERFYRGPAVERETLGTGLGLAITRRIIEDHKGQIKVTSQEGEGTMFTIYLPLEQA